MKRLFVYAVLFLYSQFGFAQCPVLPTPLVYQEIVGNLKLSKSISLNAESLPKPARQFLLEKLDELYSIHVTESNEFSQLNFVAINQGTAHEYSMNIDNEIVVTYNSNESAFNSVVTLLQLISEQDGELSIKKCFIQDEPAFEWRGLHLDVSRHFYTVAEVKRFIDLMSLYKFNKFHWHLTDDQGWRIEIKKYPLLTEIGGYRDSTLIGHYNDKPWKFNVNRTGGFYTQEEIKEVVAFAKSRNIEVVPEIEMPGHSRAALAAYPEFSCTENQLGVPGYWGVFEDTYCSKPETIEFLQDILAEVVELFPSEYIHIGGDEAPKTRWENCMKCQKVMKKNELEDEHALQSYFIQTMDDFLTEKGKKLIGWDEILEGGLSTNAAVMSWRGEQGGIDAANMHHNVVMSPTTYCYFDYYQSGNSSEPLAIGGFLPLNKVYEFSPIPKELPSENHSYILGGQANVWTEYIPNFEQVEYMVYPRAIALSENLWSVNKPSYSEFLAVLRQYHEPFLARLNVNYSKSIYLPTISLTRILNGVKFNVKGIDEQQVFDVFTKEKGGFSMGGGQVMGWNDSLYFERPQDGKQQQIQVNISAPTLNHDVSTTFLLHNGLGLPVELVSQPHPKYSHNGSLTLVDGVKGKRPWKGDDWLGFNDEKVEIIIDLLSDKKLKDITVGFLDAKGSWIYLPESMEIYTETKPNKWELISRSEIQEEYQQIELTGSTSRLKIIARPIAKIPNGEEGAGNIPWTFIDEIILNFEE